MLQTKLIIYSYSNHIYLPFCKKYNNKKDQNLGEKQVCSIKLKVKVLRHQLFVKLN